MLQQLKRSSIEWWQKPRSKLEVVILFLALLRLLWLIPERQFNVDYGELTEHEKSSLVYQYRETLVGIIGTGATGAAAIAIYFQIRDNREQFKVERAREVQRLNHERFTTAIEMLSNASVHIRLGGIYSLGQLAKDSSESRKVVLNVLSAFIREKCAKSNLKEESQKQDEDENQQIDKQRRRLQPDIAAILDVISDIKEGQECVNLSGINFSHTIIETTDLSYVNFTGAVFVNTGFNCAILDNANFSCADLSESIFSCKQITGVDFSGARIRNAHLNSMSFDQVDIFCTDFFQSAMSNSDFRESLNTRSAKFGSAMLQGSNFRDLDLSRVNFINANLISAILDGAILNDARLSRAKLNNASCIETDLNHADLCDTELEGTVLFAADLRRAKNLQVEQFQPEPQPLLCNTALPAHIVSVGIESNCSQAFEDLCERLIRINIFHRSTSTKFCLNSEEESEIQNSVRKYVQEIIEKAQEKKWN